MITEEQYVGKTCLFCVSDFHLEMILLPYIKEKMYNEDIIIMTEKNLEESLNTLLTKINLKEEDKLKIKSLDWKNKNLLKHVMKGNDKILHIIVNGSVSYIKKINKIISEIKDRQIEVVNCFHIEEKDVDVSVLSQEYKKILNTQKI